MFYTTHNLIIYTNLYSFYDPQKYTLILLNKFIYENNMPQHISLKLYLNIDIRKIQIQIQIHVHLKYDM